MSNTPIHSLFNCIENTYQFIESYNYLDKIIHPFLSLISTVGQACLRPFSNLYRYMHQKPVQQNRIVKKEQKPISSKVTSGSKNSFRSFSLPNLISMFRPNQGDVNKPVTLPTSQTIQDTSSFHTTSEKTLKRVIVISQIDVMTQFQEITNKDDLVSPILEIIEINLNNDQIIELESTHPGLSPLAQACHKGDTDKIAELIKSTPIDTKTNYDCTPLMFAVMNNKIETVKFLIENKANINAQNKQGITPLMMAASNRSQEIVELLLKNNVNINMQENDGWTALMFASFKGYDEIVDILIKNKATTNTKNKDDWNALMFACEGSHLATVFVLLNQDLMPNVNIQDIYEWTPLMIASEKGEIAIVNELIDKGASINETNSDGWTALMLAVQHGHIEIVEKFISLKNNSQDLNSQKNNQDEKNNALLIACHFGQFDIFKMLLDNGAHIYYEYEGKKLKEIAAESDHQEIVNFIDDFEKNRRIENEGDERL